MEKNSQRESHKKCETDLSTEMKELEKLTGIRESDEQFHIREYLKNLNPEF